MLLGKLAALTLLISLSLAIAFANAAPPTGEEELEEPEGEDLAGEFQRTVEELKKKKARCVRVCLYLMKNVRLAPRPFGVQTLWRRRRC
jgi:hypothetical protein